MASDLDQLSRADLVQLLLELRAEVVRLRERVEELEGKNPTQRLDESYSVKAEHKRRSQSSKQKQQQNSERRGRRPTQEKVDQADDVQLILPDGYNITECTFVRERPVWRIVDGQARRIVYEIYHGPDGRKPVLPGVPPRSEFGTEIHIAIAYVVFITGLSMDKACAQLKFFWKLELSKSQADALLNQLSSQWESEFETLCELLAASAVVHADETSWSVNSVWAFLSEQARVLVFGCRKDGDTLAQMLAKDTFSGVLVSDNAAVYKGFRNAQKCWAHLIRKAIRQHLLFPENEEYRVFLDGLLKVFHHAKRVAVDRRFCDAGRAAKVSDLENELASVCLIRCEDHIDGPRNEDDREFYNLVHEIVGLMMAEELFTFVVHANVAATNNEAERSLRSSALDRKTGRTSKTYRGARRRTVFVSVFESLKLHLEGFNLSSVLTEVESWRRTGETLFTKLRAKAGLDPPTASRVKTLIPGN